MSTATASPVQEPICQEETDRSSLTPIKYPEIWDGYKRLQALDWKASEIANLLAIDRAELATGKVPAGVRGYLKVTLGLFAFADKRVIANLAGNIIQRIKVTEFCYYYCEQQRQEQIHDETYTLIVDAYFSHEEREEIHTAVVNNPVLAKLDKWAKSYMDESKPLGMCIFAFALFEGVVFQREFMTIQQIKNLNILPGLTTANELISRDEWLHCLMACLVLKKYTVTAPSQAEVKKTLRELMAILDELQECAITSSIQASVEAGELPAGATECNFPNITRKKMHDYVRAVADNVITEMSHYKIIYGVENPYPEQVQQALNQQAKTNFFEYSARTQYNQDFDTSFGLEENGEQLYATCAAVAENTPTLSSGETATSWAERGSGLSTAQVTACRLGAGGADCVACSV